MRFVKQVESNVKKGCNVTLGPKTLIVGPNGTGKSTIINAIELAGSGRASDIAGRITLAKDTELATLIRSGDPVGSASILADDGAAASWTLTPGSKAVRTGAEVEFPLREIRDNLLGAPETARKWLLGHVAKGMEWTGVLASIPAALHARISTLAGGVVLGLPTALEVAKSKAREETKRAADLRANAQTASTGLPPPLTDAEIEAAKLDATSQAREVLAQVRERGRIAIARVEKLKLDVKAATDTRAALPPPAKIADVGGAMIKVLEGQIETGGEKCGICGGANPVEAAAKRRDQINGLIKSAVDAEARRATATRDLNAAQALLTTEQSHLASLADEVKRLIVMIDSAPEPSIVAERRGQWKAVQDQEAAALAAQRTAGEWTELVAALSGAVSRIVDTGRAAFEDRVQAFMPKGYRFGLDLGDTTVRYGLRVGPDGNEGAVRPALSGAEWAIVTSALAAAVLPANKLAIIVPEDRPFDPATLAATMLAFGSIDAQVIIATPTMPTSVPDGWTVIAVGGEIAKSVAAPTPTVQAPVTVAAPAPVGKKRGRPSKAELAQRTLAAAAQANTAPAPASSPATGDLFAAADPAKVCPGCNVREDLPPHLHSKACSIHGEKKANEPDDFGPRPGRTVVIQDGKLVSDQEPAIADLFT